MALAGSWSDVGGAHIQAFTFSSQDHGRLSIVHISKHSLFSWRRHSQDHGRLSGVWCGVCVVCVVVVCCVVVLWWCVCVVCGEAWHTLSLSLLFSLLPLLFPFLFLSSIFFSLLFLFLCLLLLFLLLLLLLFFLFLFFLLSSLLLTLLFSSLHANKHCTKHWSTNTASNFEAFECDVAHGTFIATANELHRMFPPLLLPPLLSSLLPPSHTQKKEGDFLLQVKFWRGIYFYYSFKSIKKKSPLGEITGVTVLN